MPRSTKPVVTKPSTVLQRPSTVLQRPSESGLFSSIKQGFGFGMGSSIAHNIFDRTHVTDKTDKTIEFKQCMEKTYNYEECKTILK
jgi:hypothetical protein